MPIFHFADTGCCDAAGRDSRLRIVRSAAPAAARCQGACRQGAGYDEASYIQDVVQWH